MFAVQLRNVHRLTRVVKEKTESNGMGHIETVRDHTYGKLSFVLSPPQCFTYYTIKQASQLSKPGSELTKSEPQFKQ